LRQTTIGWYRRPDKGEADGDRERGLRIVQGAERIERKLRKAARECCRRPNERGK
jgi:hypothetical protein